MHKTWKPVRKCHGCKLNLGDRCGVFDDPHKQWQSGECRGFGNDDLYQRYLDGQAKHPPDTDREERRERAKLAKTEPHHDGTRSHQSPFVGN